MTSEPGSADEIKNFHSGRMDVATPHIPKGHRHHEVLRAMACSELERVSPGKQEAETLEWEPAVSEGMPALV